MSLNLSDFYTDKNKNRRIISTPKFLDAYSNSDNREAFRHEFAREILKRSKLTTYDIDFLETIGYRYYDEKDLINLDKRLVKEIHQFNGHSYGVLPFMKPRKPDPDIVEWSNILKTCSQLEEKYLGKDENKILLCLLLNSVHHGRLKFKTKHAEKDFISEFKEFILKKGVLTLPDFTMRFYDNADSLYKKNIHSLYQFIRKS